uniref:Uncharacterized protein n=1 Tax=Hyaloperonospora arabidopsidis (strain Emoy2) TaxID=559515 RepID=M4C3J7_HYAAE
MEKIDMVSIAKGRGRAPAPRRNTNTISNTGEKLKQLHESALALLYFIKTMSLCVAQEVGDNYRQAGTTSWYRYGSLNFQRSRKAMKIGLQRAAQEATAWREVSDILAWQPGCGSVSSQRGRRNKYFVL